MNFPFYLPCPRGTAELLCQELLDLGLKAKQKGSGCEVEGGLAAGYTACLHSFIANRVFLPLSEFPAATPEELYEGVKRIPWEKHLDAQASLAIEADLSDSNLTHSHFAALKSKDALVDYFREKTGQRPRIEKKDPDIRLHLFIHQNQARLSLDFSGHSLHFRGYRPKGVDAPLKENLAAALLFKMGWPQLAQAGAAFIDPFCGSGTLCIEAYMIAAKLPPAWGRVHWGFQRWKGHDESLWQKTRLQAKQKIKLLPYPILGLDINPLALRQARASADALGISGKLSFEREAAEEFRLPQKMRQMKGLILGNPPYGERLGDEEDLFHLHQSLGQALKSSAQGWRFGLFTPREDLAFALGIRADKSNRFYNGAIECRLFQFTIDPSRELKEKNKLQPPRFWTGHTPSPEATALANRLRKNLKKLKTWKTQNKIECYRLYNKDLPEYSFALDIYGKDCLAFEYEPPPEIDPSTAKGRRYDFLASLAPALGFTAENIFYKERKSQKGRGQYEKNQEWSEKRTVTEGGLRFEIDLLRYLDTGLFLDSRSIRQWIFQEAKGKRFLNLFSYSCTASVYATAGGAAQCVSLDLNPHYLEWGQRNFTLNHLDPHRHAFIATDVLTWLNSAQGGYDLILLDPPSFSNSKKMQKNLDIQTDHPRLIQAAANLLTEQGKLYFMTNKRGFKLKNEALKGLRTIQRKDSLPLDFQGGRPIHQLWEITRSLGAGPPNTR